MGFNRNSIPVLLRAHTLQSTGKPPCITVLASLADFYATGHRIPGGLGPFYSGWCSHDYSFKWQMICPALLLAICDPFGFPTQKINLNNGLSVKVLNQIHYAGCRVIKFFTLSMNRLTCSLVYSE